MGTDLTMGDMEGTGLIMGDMEDTVTMEGTMGDIMGKSKINIHILATLLSGLSIL